MNVTQTERLLLNVKADTATGHDDLPGFLLRQYASVLAPNLTLIFNSCFNEGIFPTVWKCSNVTAIWKGKGSKSDPSNYRPISVIPVVARVFEKAMAAQLHDYCDSRSIIPSEQFGFRRKSNCESALL